MMNVVEAAWETLLQARRPEDGWHCRRLDARAEVPILAAIHRPGDTPSLLVECNSSSLPAVPEFPHCNGFRLFSEQLAPGPHGSVRLCLVLEDPRYREVFAVLAGDVFSSICSVSSEPQLVRVLLGRLHSWQVFMQRHSPDGLTLEEQIGLAAECVILRRFLIGAIPARSGVEAWQGPAGGARDFVLPSVVIEVKGTSDARPTIHIASLEQLADSEGGHVLLALVLFRQGGEASLPDLVDDVRATIAAEDASALVTFDRKLLEAGYLEAHRSRYSSRSIKVQTVQFFHVEPGFPRITHSDVNPGIDSCSYSIRLANCLPFETGLDIVSSFVRGVEHE